MKSRVKIQLLLWGLFLGSSCDRNEEIPVDTRRSDLGVSIGIHSEATRSSVLVEGKSFSHESQINVLLVDYNGTGSLDYDASAPYTYKDPTTTLGVWLPNEASRSLQINNKEARVLAHYPAVLPNGSSLSSDKRTLTAELTTTLTYGNILNGEYNGDNSFFFPSAVGGPPQEIFLADGEVDYLVGASATPASNKTEESKKANIVMKHGLSLVVFHVQKSADNTIKGMVKSIDVTNINPTTGPLRKGSFDIQSGTFTPAASRVAYRRTMDGFYNSSHFGMMVYPATIGIGEVKIKLLVDEASIYSITIPPRSWSPGKVYFYQIMLNPIGAELMDEVLVIDWVSGKETEFEID